MNDHSPEPNTEQITVWRNLLDAFGQLSAAWEAAREAQSAAGAGSGPAESYLPESLVASFARAGQETAETLTGVAEVLHRQGEDGDSAPFADVLETQRTARDRWSTAHDAISGA